MILEADPIRGEVNRSSLSHPTAISTEWTIHPG